MGSYYRTKRRVPGIGGQRKTRGWKTGLGLGPTAGAGGEGKGETKYRHGRRHNVESCPFRFCSPSRGGRRVYREEREMGPTRPPRRRLVRRLARHIFRVRVRSRFTA